MARGSIRPSGKGSWEVRLRVPDPTTGKSRQRSWTIQGTRADAERALAIRVTQLLDGKLSGEERALTLADHVDDWIAVQERRISRKSVSSYRGLLVNHVLPTLGGLRLTEITTRQIDGVYQRRMDEGLSNRTVRYIHVVLRRCLEDAVRWGALRENPADHATPPKAKRGTSVQAWSPESAREFLDAIEGDPHPCAGVWRACLMLGLRRGEALGLRWEDVDLDAGTVRVEQSYVRDGDAGLRMVPPKTEKSRRTVAMDERTHVWLAGRAQRSGLVFATEAGTPFDPDVVSKTFGRFCDSRGLPRIRLHDLRHTQASLALAAGVPLKVVSERLGHSGVGITADIYTHVSESLHRDSAGRVAELLYPPPAS